MIRERIFKVIYNHMPKRGAITMLAEESGIARTTWQNVANGKQRATEEIMEFVCSKWPEFAFWISTGTVPQDNLEHRSAHKAVQIGVIDTTLLQKEPTKWSEEDIKKFESEAFDRNTKKRFPNDLFWLVLNAYENSKLLKDWIAIQREKITLEIKDERGNEMGRAAQHDLARFNIAVALLKEHGAKTD